MRLRLRRSPYHYYADIRILLSDAPKAPLPLCPAIWSLWKQENRYSFPTTSLSRWRWDRARLSSVRPSPAAVCRRCSAVSSSVSPCRRRADGAHCTPQRSQAVLTTPQVRPHRSRQAQNGLSEDASARCRCPSRSPSPASGHRPVSGSRFHTQGRCPSQEHARWHRSDCRRNRVPTIARNRSRLRSRSSQAP